MLLRLVVASEGAGAIYSTMHDRPQAYTVAAITRLIKSTLEDSFPSVWVEGEISNYIHHSSGHRYFSLKDDKAVLRTTIWRSMGMSLRFEPENGQKVLAFGDISLYEKAGQYQLNCRKLIPAGIGELELAFRQLHKRLSREGLFNTERKQEMPEYPMRIGVVTSPTGAAIRDIIQISNRRNPAVQLVVFPAQVQGDGAEKTIAAGISYFNTRDDIDVIIVGRGGGSLEDLWPFNTEVTVRAIVNSAIPVISAVGHEVDISLSDYAADLHVPTPSAAAELAVWSRDEFLQSVAGNVQQQSRLLRSQVQQARQRLSSLLARPVLARPTDTLRQRQQHLDQLIRGIMRVGKNRFETFENRLSLAMLRLETLSPLLVMKRGYSVSRTLPDRSVVKSITQLQPGEKMETLVTDGTVVSMVEKIEESGNGNQDPT